MAANARNRIVLWMIPSSNLRMNVATKDPVARSSISSGHRLRGLENKPLDQEAEFSDVDIRRQTTWAMSDQGRAFNAVSKVSVFDVFFGKSGFRRSIGSLGRGK